MSTPLVFINCSIGQLHRWKRTPFGIARAGKVEFPNWKQLTSAESEGVKYVVEEFRKYGERVVVGVSNE